MKPRSPLSLCAFYFTAFALLGVYLPYFNLYLEALGLTGFQIGVLAAAVPLGKVVFGPLWSLWADRMGSRKGVALLSVGLATVTFSLLLRVDRFEPMGVILYLYAALLAPQLPLVEASTLELADRHGWQYGRIRVWGSVGFIAAALALGRLLDALAIRYVVHAVLAVSLANLVATAAIPAVRPRRTGRQVQLTTALFRPRVVAFFGCTLLMQASHGAYYAFFSIVMAQAGYRRNVIGILWSLGVIAEMITMISAGRLLRRFGVAALMTACLSLAVLRWSAYAWTTWLPILLVAQALHAFTFGAFHVAAVTGTHRLFPERLRASGQSLYSGLTYGAGSVLGFLGSGKLYEWVGSRELFLASAVTALAAALLSVGLWGEGRLRRGAGPEPEAI